MTKQTKITKLDTTSQALLLSSLARSARLPLCAMCVCERRIETHNGQEYIVCTGCRDAVPLPVNVVPQEQPSQSGQR